MKVNKHKPIHVLIYAVSDGTNPYDSSGWFSEDSFVKGKSNATTVDFGDPLIRDGIAEVLKDDGYKSLKLIRVPKPTNRGVHNESEQTKV